MPLFFLGPTSLQNSLPPLPSDTEGCGKGAVFSSSHMVSVTTFSSWRELLSPFSCSSTGALPQQKSSSNCSHMGPTYFHFFLWLQRLWHNNFFPFLNLLSQRLYHCHWWAEPWSSWNWLALVLSDMGEASGSFLQKPLWCIYREPGIKSSL